MKAMIQKILEEICALPVPKEPVQIQKIFTTFPEFTAICSSNEIEECAQQLMVVQKLAATAIELDKKINGIKLHAEGFVQYQLREQVLLQAQRESKDKEMQHRQQIANCCQQILLVAGQHADIQTTELTPAITKRQLEYIKVIRKRLADEVYVLELPIAKLKLLELKEELVRLLAQLYNLAEFHSLGLKAPIAEDAASFAAERSSLYEALQQYIKLQPQFSELQERFAQNLSMHDAQDKAMELQTRKAAIIKSIDLLKVKIKVHLLSEDSKNKLIDEFNKSPNIQQLINSYASQVDSLLSYVDPSAWFGWVTNKAGYSKQQAESSLSVEFLNLLLLQQQELEAEANIGAQLDALDKVSNTSGYNKERESDLIEQVRALIEATPKRTIPIAFKAEQPAADYYLALIDNMMLLPQRIKQHEALVALLDQIVPVIKQLDLVRETYHLNAAQDNLLPSIEELKQAIPNGAEELLVQKQEHLKQSNALMAQIKALIEQLKKEFQSQETITFNLTVVKRALENKLALQNPNSFAQQIEVLSLEKSTLQEDIAQKVSSIIVEIPAQIKSDAHIGMDTTERTPLVVLQDSKEPVVKSERLVVEKTAVEQEAGHLAEKTVDDKNLTQADTVATETKKEPVVSLEQGIVVATADTKEHTVKQVLHEIQQVEQATVERVSVETPSSALHTDAKTTAAAVVTVTLDGIETEEPLESRVSEEHSAQDGIEIVADTMVSALQERLNLAKHHQCLADESAPHYVPESHALQQLERWHQENRSSLVHYSESIQHWYTELYQVALTAIRKQPASYQHIHLLRDLSFALKNGLAATVHAYQRMAPKPQDDCQALLALKPNAAILTTESIEELDACAQLPLPFKKLYTQHTVLKPHHPMEAELLLQALHSLFSVYQTKGKLDRNEFPQINQDPCYEPLKRHRGFLRAWEIIEDFFRMLLGKLCGKAEYIYQERPCFFKTNSGRLLEKTEEFINEQASLGG